MKFQSTLTPPLSFAIVKNAPSTGRIDSSLPNWSFTTATLSVTDATGATEEMARTTVENFAGGGYDLDLSTRNLHVAAALATHARGWNPSENRGDNLTLIGEWIVANPESLATSYEDAPF
jgi:hypothetical protein